jgi:hypothetical protein
MHITVYGIAKIGMFIFCGAYIIGEINWREFDPKMLETHHSARSIVPGDDLPTCVK